MSKLKMTKKGTNILNSLLVALDVKHTEAFSNKHFNEHPHKYNLFGISEMLTDYNIENGGIRIEDKQGDIKNIPTPFIGQVGGDFAVVYDVKDKVEYRVGSLNLELPLKSFCEKWSGIVLLIQKTEYSIEPNYTENRKKELTHQVLKNTLLLTAVILLVTGLISNKTYSNTGIILSFIINTIGLFITFLLIQKTLKIHSNYSDKICSLLKKSDCNNILETSVSKLWGIFGWSEIGFSYFLANILIISFLPELSIYYAIINLLVLPFTFWSIWYQKFKAKQWCTLCLIVQIVLWGIFIVNIAYPSFEGSYLTAHNTITILALYLITFISITLLIPYFAERSKFHSITQEINSLKAHEGVVTLLLQEQPYHSVDESTSQILFGNPDAKVLISILTNPHCGPCAKMHLRVEKLLKSGADVCVQYIFSSFNQELDVSNKFLIAVYLSKNIVERTAIFNDWFSSGKYSKEKFFKKYPIDLTGNEVQIELAKHKKWKSDNKFESTPTILINGYKLPQNYQIEDFRYITELKLENGFRPLHHSVSTY